MNKCYFTATYNGTGYTRDYLRRLKKTAKFSNIKDNFGRIVLTNTQNVITKNISEIIKNVEIGEEVKFTATFDNERLLYIKSI